MKLHNKNAEIFVPDGLEWEDAVARTTHLGVGAHQDDLEIMAFHGILQCFGQADHWFAGVTCTNGSGSPRSGMYETCTDKEMQKIRRVEQRNAAILGQYGAMIQLDYPSAAVKKPSPAHLQADLVRILKLAQPEIVYTHNPADKHETHTAVFSAVIRALRELPKSKRPRKVCGCETWRDLDWLPDEEKVVLDVGGRDNLAAALLGVFDSQIAGGKRYDLAAMARRRANATFFQSHATDETDQITFAMDLSPLIRDDRLDISGYVQGLIDRFKRDVGGKLRKFLPRVGKT